MNERKRAADQRLSVELPGIEPAAKSRVLLRGQTTRWDVADMSGMARLLAFLQVSNWDSELARLKVARLDGPEAPRALDPVYAERLPVTTPPGMAAGSAADRPLGDLDRFVAAT